MCCTAVSGQFQMEKMIALLGSQATVERLERGDAPAQLWRAGLATWRSSARCAKNIFCIVSIADKTGCLKIILTIFGMGMAIGSSLAEDRVANAEHAGRAAI